MSLECFSKKRLVLTSVLSNAASEGNNYASAMQSDNNIYPSLHSGAYPILRRYFDLSPIVEQGEFGIGSVAPILSAFAYFSN